jgi:single-stranded DNA-binding protein
MTARVIVSGVIGKPADIRTSKKGNQFATFPIRENVNGASRWWQAISFSETVIETSREMQVGEPIAVAGEFNAETYAPAGAEARVNLRITVDAVLTARKAKPDQDANLQLERSQASRKSQAARNAPADGKAHAERSWAAPRPGPAPLDDDIPFGPEWR